MPNLFLHSINIYVADGATDEWDFRFDGVNPDDNSGTTPYLHPDDVKVQVIHTAADGSLVVEQRDRQLIAPNRVRVLGPQIPAGYEVKVYRETENRYPLVDYRDMQTVGSADLDLHARQTLFVAMEAIDVATLAEQASARAENSAGEANVTAEEARDIAEEARTTANTANATADAANATAQDARDRAQSAVDLATEAKEDADAVRGLAEQAGNDAASAAASAAQAATDAATAVSVAGAVDGKASDALENSEFAVTQALAAKDIAEGIDAKATEALANSATALSTANEAKQTADGIEAKADLAISTANSATATANSATDTANSAVATANSALAASATNAADIASTQTYAEENRNRIAALSDRTDGLEDRVTVIEDRIKPHEITDIHAGEYSTLFLVRGVLYSSIQSGSYLQHGRGVTPMNGIDSVQPVPIPDASPVVEAGCMGTSAYALCENGDLYTWGNNDSGECGTGSTASVPVPVLSATNVRRVFRPRGVGYNNANGRLIYEDNDRVLWGSGHNAGGALGVGSTTNYSGWVRIHGSPGGLPEGTVIERLWSLGSTYGNTFALTAGGRLLACGRNISGSIGDGTTVLRSSWVDVTDNWGGESAVAKILDVCGGYGFRESEAYSRSFTCVVMSDAVYVAGNNLVGTVGTGSTSTQVTTPYKHTFNVKDYFVSGAGDGGIGIIDTDGRLFVWGYYNNAAQANVTELSLPRAARKFLATGQDNPSRARTSLMMFSLEPDADGHCPTYSLGSNGTGAFGDGTTVASSVPVRMCAPVLNSFGEVINMEKAVFVIGTAAWGVVALDSEDHVWVWGSSSGNILLNATTSNILTPYRVRMAWEDTK